VSIGSTNTPGGIRAGSRRALPFSRYTVAGALVVLALGALAVVLLSSTGSTDTSASSRATVSRSARRTAANPRAATGASGIGVKSAHGGLAGIGAAPAAKPGGANASVTIGPDGAASASEVRDPEEAKSFPEPANVRHRAASTPSVAGEAAVASGAASDAEIRKELGEEEHAKAQEQAARHRILTPASGGFSVGGDGTIPIPTNVPEVVQRVVAGGNAIADFPYIWGGGHGSFVANGYDCSGSVSYALAAGGLLRQPLVSGDLANWGDAGPGQWITIYANAGHTFMDVAGMWFDTAGRSGPYASRWLVAQPSLAGYAVRHPPGL
jgi:cell wall-associated NlpC family hydrolase